MAWHVMEFISLRGVRCNLPPRRAFSSSDITYRWVEAVLMCSTLVLFSVRSPVDKKQRENGPMKGRIEAGRRRDAAHEPNLDRYR